jgi:hypothetical protein
MLTAQPFNIITVQPFNIPHRSNILTVQTSFNILTVQPFNISLFEYTNPSTIVQVSRRSEQARPLR